MSKGERLVLDPRDLPVLELIFFGGHEHLDEFFSEAWPSVTDKTRLNLLLSQLRSRFVPGVEALLKRPPLWNLLEEEERRILQRIIRKFEGKPFEELIRYTYHWRGAKPRSRAWGFDTSFIIRLPEQADPPVTMNTASAPASATPAEPSARRPAREISPRTEPESAAGRWIAPQTSAKPREVLRDPVGGAGFVWLAHIPTLTAALLARNPTLSRPTLSRRLEMSEDEVQAHFTGAMRTLIDIHQHEREGEAVAVETQKFLDRLHGKYKGRRLSGVIRRLLQGKKGPVEIHFDLAECNFTL